MPRPRGTTKVIFPPRSSSSQLAEVLKDEGFIKDVSTHADEQAGRLTVILKYDARPEPAISDIKRL